MNEEKPYLGRGWSFPPTFNRESCAVELVEGETDINQSLEILLSTSLGERVMQPKYGCNLKDFLFEPMSTSFIGFIKDLVESAILYYEPRIKLDRIDFGDSLADDLIEGRLRILIDYRIRETNSRFNFVYDFYLKEGVEP